MINLRSKPRRALLAYYFTNPQANHYLRELAGVLRLDPANLSRELARLQAEGLFLSEQRGQQKYFRLNRGYPLYEEMRRIVFKTIGVAARLRDTLQEIPGIKEAWLYGSFAAGRQDAASDIDLLIIGEPKAEKLEAGIRKLERELGREINYTSLSPEEFRRRQRRKDAFLEDVWRHKKVKLLPPP